MLNPVVARRVQHAEAVAVSARDMAGACRSDQPALREALLQHAQVIDELIALVESMTLVARINHDTIINRRVS